MNIFKKLRSIFKTRIRPKVKASYDISNYLKDTVEVKLNYTYEVSSSPYHTKYSIGKVSTLNKELVNEDITNLRKMSDTGLVAINIKNTDYRSLLNSINSDCIFAEYHSYLVYKNENKLKKYKSKDGRLEAYVADSIKFPVRMLTVNDIGDTSYYTFGTKPSDIAQTEAIDRTLLFVGEYFGIIRKDSKYEFAYLLTRVF